MGKKWIIITFCIVALITAAIGITLTVQAVDSPPADQTGPYKVGFVANTYYDSTRSDYAGGPRPIVTFIWYPVDPEIEGELPPAVYPMNVSGLPGLPDASSTDFEAYGIDSAYQEVAPSQDGPFPLVVFSPGMNGDSLGYVHIGTRLASHGFVVAIPTNFDDRVNTQGLPEFYKTLEAYSIGPYLERTRDIEYLLNQLLAESQQSSNLLSGTIQPDQIAVSGHSLGGLAALALTGGDDSACDWRAEGMDPNNIPPEICSPIPPDPRIKAIVPLDPSSYVLKYAEMERIEVPSMIIGQEYSALVAAQTGTETLLVRPHAAIQGDPNYRLDVSGAIHNSFSTYCEVLHILNDKGFIDDQLLETVKPYNCPPEPFSAAEIETLTTQYMIAFLKTELVGERGYQEILTAEYVQENEPLIEFFEIEQGDPSTPDEDGYFSYFLHQPGSERATALKDP
jgi:predicted dienelactone hydrolase